MNAMTFTEDFLLRDELFQLATEQDLTAELADCSVVRQKEVRVIAVQDDAVAFWYCIRMIRLCHLHTTPPPLLIVHIIIFMVALCNRADHYIFMLWFDLCSFFFLSFFSSPNLSGRRLDVYHTLAHGVALVRI